MSENRLAILGSGPAGLAAANELAAAGRKPLVIERDDAPGGLCRTLEFKGFLFDLGGHRFLTNYDEVKRVWSEVMGDDMLSVTRLSRIFYDGKFFRYPISAANALANLGAGESLRCIGSYLAYHLRPDKGESFESLMSNRFGRRLFEIFFKTYTEKVWGIPCRALSADWATQRIEGLSLAVAIRKALMGSVGQDPKTLSESFLYPRTGPGEFYRRYQSKAAAAGAEFQFGYQVTALRHSQDRVTSVGAQAIRRRDGIEIPVDGVISSLPLPVLIEMLDPLPPAEVREAAKRLRFRNHLMVNLILNRDRLFPDQWIYVQSPEVRLARIQNYKNWSPAMVPDPRKTSLGLEYFSSDDDPFWDLPDSELIAWALSDIERIGLASRNDLVDSFVTRQRHAYPVYDMNYQSNLATVRTYLKTLPNLLPTGRAGLFRYCNSDLALLTGLYAARNLLSLSQHDLWNIQ